MKFLFRSHLFDFEPEREEEIRDNWTQILEAIRISSPSLHQKIQGYEYSDLSYSVKLKLKKYMIRGRYRSTPFGKFAGVGIGNTTISAVNLDLNKTLLLGEAKPKEASNSVVWHLSLEGYSKLNRRTFLGYLVQEERWAMVSIPDNKVVEKLVDYFKSQSSLTQGQFRSWFEDENLSFVDEIWNRLVELGILYQGEKWLNDRIKLKHSTDVVFQESIGLHSEAQRKIAVFFETAGNLLTEAKSFYLNHFKDWFRLVMDDRFVPLSLLLDYPEFVSSDFLNFGQESEQEKKFWGSPFSIHESEELDLRTLLGDAPIGKEIYCLDLALKVLGDNQILVENAVCNRPFTFFGRFNRDEKIFEFSQEVKETIYQNKDVIFAELKIFETPTVQSICNTYPLFEWYISPFHEDHPSCIQLNEIELGVRNGEIILIHVESGREIIPVVTHPLNGKEISHPIMRLLWELDHQHSYKFVHYHSPFFTDSDYLPRLTWGDVILLSRRWTVYSDQFKEIEGLRAWLIAKRLPNPLLAGIYDRELLIEWKKEDHLAILWSEIKRNPRSVLSEVLWLGNSPYESMRGSKIYPQLVVSHRKPLLKVPWEGFVNSVEFEEKNWIYLLFRISLEDFEETFQLVFSKGFITGLNMKAAKWYYLVYPEGEMLQVRLRVLVKNPELKNEVSFDCFKQLGTIKLAFEQRPYYPEVKKYGKETYSLSEDLFWLESELLVSNLHKGINGKDWPTFMVEGICDFWIEVILKTKLDNYLFPIVKERVKRIPYSEKKQIEKGGEERFFPQKLPMRWKRLYKRKILEHLNHWEEEKMKWQILSNHIHMQINRFFPLDRKHMENRLYCLIYRELGKRVYRERK